MMTDDEIGNLLGRSYWREAIRLERPDATKEELQQSWSERGADYRRLGRRVQRRLLRDGFALTKIEPK